MATDSKAALELKRLRERAGLSVRQLASALKAASSRYGRSPSTYAYYENDYKKPYLPGEFAEDLAPILQGRGSPPIREREVLVLAGPAQDSLWIAPVEFSQKPALFGEGRVEPDLLSLVLGKLSLALSEGGLNLDDQQRAATAAELYRRVARASIGDRSSMLQEEIARLCELAKSLVRPR